MGAWTDSGVVVDRVIEIWAAYSVEARRFGGLTRELRSALDDLVATSVAPEPRPSEVR